MPIVAVRDDPNGPNMLVDANLLPYMREDASGNVFIDPALSNGVARDAAMNDVILKHDIYIHDVGISSSQKIEIIKNVGKSLLTSSHIITSLRRDISIGKSFSTTMRTRMTRRIQKSPLLMSSSHTFSLFRGKIVNIMIESTSDLKIQKEFFKPINMSSSHILKIRKALDLTYLFGNSSALKVDRHLSKLFIFANTFDSKLRRRFRKHIRVSSQNSLKINKNLSRTLKFVSDSNTVLKINNAIIMTLDFTSTSKTTMKKNIIKVLPISSTGLVTINKSWNRLKRLFNRIGV